MMGGRGEGWVRVGGLKRGGQERVGGIDLSEDPSELGEEGWVGLLLLACG